MATLLHRVSDNFIYQIQQISPTSSITRNRYVVHEPSRNSEPWSAARQFHVEWTDSDNELDSSDSDYREAWHNFLVSVIYPLEYSDAQLERLILLDRHDLAKRLRRKEFAKGVTGDASLKVGLMNRHRTGDELNRDSDSHWILTTKWRCKVQESEM
jgi:hypothetical protein